MKQSFLLFVCSCLLGLSAQAQTLPLPSFSHERGFVEDSLLLEIHPGIGGALVYVSTDGREPTPESGTLYTAPLEITSSTVVRARTYLQGETSAVATHTYLFLQDVIQQPAQLPGWPNPVYPTDYRGGQATMDHEMDPAIVQNEAYREDLLLGLTDIPSVCLAMPQEDFWEMNDGWMEKASSVEILYPQAPEASHQANGGIEGMSHRHQKRSYRLEFKQSYGPKRFQTDIFQRTAPLNRETAADEFEHLVLRAGTQRNWARNWIPDGAAFMRDQWYRDSQIALSGDGLRGTYVHLYVNAVYFGLFNLIERPNKGFAETYLGGDDDDWFVFNHNGYISGDSSRWEYLMESLIQEDLRDPEVYAEVGRYLDIPQFVDYLILTWMTGMVDWPNNNYYGLMRMDKPGPLKFFAWDCEQSWDEEFGAHPGAWVPKAFRADSVGGPPIAALFNALKHNPDFMSLWADRVHAHCVQGALRDDAQRRRWDTLAQVIERAVVAESARWGDALEDGVTRTRDEHWRAAVSWVDSIMNGNVDRFLAALRDNGYYPAIRPPVLSHAGGLVAPAFTLALTNPNEKGTIYYRLDGGDPRLPGGALAPEAQIYEAPISFPTTLPIVARVKVGNQWSAAQKATFQLDKPLSGVYINEWLASNGSDTTDASGKHADWIEIYNASEQPVNVGGLYLSDDLTEPTMWQIPSNAPRATTIPPGGYLLLWADKDPEEGPTHLDLRLDAEGDLIGLFQQLDGTPQVLDLVRFGPQLRDVSQGRFPDGSSEIRSFVQTTPAGPNVLVEVPQQEPIDQIYINEFMASNQADTTDEEGKHEDWIELYNADTVAVDVGGLFLTDNLSNPTKWQLPADRPEATTIEPGGFLLLWADEDEDDGPTHLGFKLSKDGEAIALVQRLDTQVVFVDYVAFGPQETDVSEGRFPNGGERWQPFEAPTPGASNVPDSLLVDCAGMPGGEALIDSCGQCLLPSELAFNECLREDTLAFLVGSLPLGVGDQAIAHHLRRLGFDVLPLLDRDADPKAVRQLAGVLISSSVRASEVDRAFASIALPLMVWEPFLYPGLRLTSKQQAKDFDHADRQNMVRIMAPGHPLAAGMEGSLRVLNARHHIPWGVPNSAAQVIATLPANPSQATLFAYEAGSPMVGGKPAAARRLACWLNDESIQNWTAQGLHLFEASVCWLFGCSGETLSQAVTEGGAQTGAFALRRPQLYPNPADVEAELLWELRTLEPVQVEVVDLMGKVLMKEQRLPQDPLFRLAIPTQTLATGMYTLRVRQGDEIRYRKLQVKH